MSKFFKITNESECHHGFQYNEGLNILDGEFAHEGSNVKGGFYFTNVHSILEFLSFGVNLRVIEIEKLKVLEDFHMVLDDNKWRASMIIFRDKRALEDPATYEYLIGEGLSMAFSC